MVAWRGVYKDDYNYLPGIGIAGRNTFGIKSLDTYALVNVTVFDSSGNVLPYHGPGLGGGGGKTPLPPNR